MSLQNSSVTQHRNGYSPFSPHFAEHRCLGSEIGVAVMRAQGNTWRDTCFHCQTLATTPQHSLPLNPQIATGIGRIQLISFAPPEHGVPHLNRRNYDLSKGSFPIWKQIQLRRRLVFKLLLSTSPLDNTVTPFPDILSYDVFLIQSFLVPNIQRPPTHRHQLRLVSPIAHSQHHKKCPQSHRAAKPSRRPSLPNSRSRMAAYHRPDRSKCDQGRE